VSSPEFAVQGPGGTTAIPRGAVPEAQGARRGSPDGTYHSLIVPDNSFVTNPRPEPSTTPHGPSSVSSSPISSPLAASMRVTVSLPKFVTHTSSAFAAIPSGVVPTSISRRSLPSGVTRVTVPSPLLTTQR
jgi:hypothetical protein